MENGEEEEEEEEEGGSGDAGTDPPRPSTSLVTKGLAHHQQRRGGDSARIATLRAPLPLHPALCCRCLAPPQPCASAAAAIVAASTPPQPTGAGVLLCAAVAVAILVALHSALCRLHDRSSRVRGLAVRRDCGSGWRRFCPRGPPPLFWRRRSDSPALPLAIALPATSGGGGRAPPALSRVQRHTAPTDEERRDYRLSEGSRARASR